MAKRVLSFIFALLIANPVLESFADPVCDGGLAPGRIFRMKKFAENGIPADFARNRYWSPKGQHGEIAEAQLTSLGPNFRSLIVDPGIVLRMDEFVAFVQAQGLTDSSDVWMVREKFSKHLGKKRVYRALALNPADVQAIEAHGILSSTFRNNGEDDEYPLIESLFSMALGRIRQMAPDSDPYLSVTDYPDVALAATWPYRFSGKKNFLGITRAVENGKKVYLMTLDVPVLDLLEPGKNPDRPTHFLGLAIFEPGNQLLIKNGSDKKTYPFDHQVESFVMYSIDRSEIVSIEKDERPFQYEMKPKE
ncbi:MAG: hypothetical protein JNL01_02725 [Bdellovibrionales bacterium]|nr:hypothetical protein [Bdellovibrionales bacterium]